MEQIRKVSVCINASYFEKFMILIYNRDKEVMTMTANELLKLLLKYQRQSGIQIYLVGGFIRDILLNKRSMDLDFTFQGEVGPLYEFIKASHDVVLCSEFQTMRFESVDHIHFDIATMRREIYNTGIEAYEYVPSDLKWDILRRDFTVNTAYVKFNETLCKLLNETFEKNRIEPGIIQYIKQNIYASHPLFFKDLNMGIIRLLHLSSFDEDPSRILRAVKIKNQMKAQLEEMTLKRLLSGIKAGKLSTLPLSRLQIEFSKLFKGSGWRENLETLLVYKWQMIQSDVAITISCDPDEFKRITLMSRLENHIDWLYGVDDQIKRCHEEYDRTLEAFLLNSEINDYNLYKLLYNKRVETLALIARRYKDKVMLYEKTLKAYKLNLTGHDLIRIGVPQNYKMRILMDALLEYKINHRIKLSLEDEIKYIESIKNEY